MSNTASITKNYIYNVIYHIITIAFPFITIPYVSRILGAEGLGIYAFTASIVQYFVFFGALNVQGLYGIRSIAFARDDIENRSRAFWEIFILKLVLASVSTFIFVISLLVFRPENLIIYLIQTFTIMAAIVDISWFFMGMEDFKKTVARNIAVRVIGLILIFWVIKTGDDLWKYVFIMCFTNFLGQLVIWAYIPRHIKFLKVGFQDIKKHIPLILAIFVPQVTYLFFSISDKILLGLFTSDSELGIYDITLRIVKTPVVIITAIGVVMMPRIANIIEKGLIDEIKKYLAISFDFVMYLSLPIMTCIAGVAYEFIPWFLGDEFHRSTILMAVLSFTVITTAFNNILDSQVFYPARKEKQLTVAVFWAIAVKFTLFLILVVYLGAMGAAIAQIAGEFTLLSAKFYYAREFFKIEVLFKESWKYVTAAAVAFLFIRYTGNALGAGIFTTLVQISIMIVIYPFILTLLKSEVNQRFFLKVRTKFTGKEKIA